MTETLKQKLKSLPISPGVYLFKNEKANIIYVGKAKNLKSRVSSYFRKARDHDLKTRVLVQEICDVDILVADSEVNALLLERTLIKHHDPAFNILLRDDKEFPYLRIDFNATWPRIRKVRRRKDDGATYFGPFGNAGHLNTLLQVTHRLFPTIKCSPHEFDNAKRPCNYFHMGQCFGPCTQEVDRDTYVGSLRDAVQFIQGRNTKAAASIEQRMREAAAREEFELAANYRDQLEAIKAIANKKPPLVNNIRDTDFVGFSWNGNESGNQSDHSNLAAFHILSVREGIITSQDSFVLKLPLPNPDEAITAFLLQYYENRFVPEEIAVPLDLEDAETLTAVMTVDSQRSKPPILKQPQRGQRRQLLEMADRNARFALDTGSQRESAKSVGLQILADKLGLAAPPTRMECIDISNIQATAIVASDVCFIDGHPSKENYRLYNIDDQGEAPDDYGSIRTVVERRLTRARRDGDLPDLLVIDGGKGQLNAALEAAEAFSDLNPVIVSLAKARTEGSSLAHERLAPMPRTRTSERIFTAKSETPIELEVGSPEFRIMTHIRDEAHRFAITQHRKRRSKVLHASILEEVPGIGPVMRKRLFEVFENLDGIKRASLDQLESVEGMKKTAALALYAYFRSEDETAASP